jgi:UDP-glucose 4-epimerase
MRKANAKKIVFSSSASVYGYQTKEKVSEEDLPRPDTIYGFHKLLSEQIIKSYKERYGMDFLILRLFNIYGGDPTCKKDVISLFIKRLLDKKPLILMDPNKFRDFVHVEDVAQAFQKACNTNISNEVLNVGSGIKITLRQLVDIFTSVSTNIKVIEKKTSEDGTGLYADVTLAKKLLAFNPKDPNEGLGNYIKQYYDKLSK